jgi:hypothetical protein
MFTKNKWFHRGRIESDEGFSVDFGRDIVVYYESGRRMAITADVGAGQVNIFIDTIGRWDDDPMNAVKAEEKARIANNIKRALEWRGLAVSLM